MKTQTVTSSGGVVFRAQDGSVEVALIATNDRKVWKLPKGLVEKGESLEDAAIREIQEETGLTGEIIQQIDRIEYWFVWRPHETRYHKFVYFYLVRHTGGDETKHDWEVDEVRWFAIDEAIKTLTYKSERAIVGKAKEMINELTT